MISLTLYNSPKKCFTFQATPCLAVMALIFLGRRSYSITDDANLGRISHLKNQKSINNTPKASKIFSSFARQSIMRKPKRKRRAN